MRPLRAKFGKICQWTKKIKDAVVYGWGRQIFPKSPKENKNSLNMSTACLLRKIDAELKRTNISSLFTKEFYQCLHKNLALLCGFVCDQKMSPKKLVSTDIFGSFRPTKKKHSLQCDPPLITRSSLSRQLICDVPGKSLGCTTPSNSSLCCISDAYVLSFICCCTSMYSRTFLSILGSAK